MRHARSLFRDFESYLRIVVDLDEVDIHLILKQNKANFVTYDLDPGFYTTEDLQEAVHTLGDHEGPIQIENDHLNRKTRLILARFGSTFGTIGFKEQSFFQTILGFIPFWDDKPTNAIHAKSNGVYSIK